MENRVPQGFRDLTTVECEKKKQLQSKLETIFQQFGYKPISTPTIEYYSTYEKSFDTTGEEFFQFFDQNGKTLAMRSDMTVPIARVCATKYANANPPFRFSYSADVYKIRHVFGGKLSQVTDCGIELIGLDEKSDIEVLYTAIQVLDQLGAEKYQLEIGNSAFFKKACELLNINQEQQKELAAYIDRKSLVDLDEYLNSLQLDDQAKQFFKQLPLLGGKQDVFDRALEISFHEDLKKEVASLNKLYQQLCNLGVDEHVSFDFGKIPHLDYYTGIIFEGYVDHVATSVLSGGRYDDLLAKYDRDLPACGFSVKLDYVLDTYKAQDTKTIQLLYPIGHEVEAIQKANALRKENTCVEMIPKDIEEMEVIA